IVERIENRAGGYGDLTALFTDLRVLGDGYATWLGGPHGPGESIDGFSLSRREKEQSLQISSRANRRVGFDGPLAIRAALERARASVDVGERRPVGRCATRGQRETGEKSKQ